MNMFLKSIIYSLLIYFLIQMDVIHVIIFGFSHMTSVDIMLVLSVITSVIIAFFILRNKERRDKHEKNI